MFIDCYHSLVINNYKECNKKRGWLAVCFYDVGNTIRYQQLVAGNNNKHGEPKHRSGKWINALNILCSFWVGVMSRRKSMIVCCLLAATCSGYFSGLNIQMNENEFNTAAFYLTKAGNHGVVTKLNY